LNAVEVLFWTAAAVVVFSYVVYPLLLATIALVRPAPAVRKGAWRPRVTLVIIAHNEERWLESKIQSCLEQDYPHDLLDIMVVSDGSTDRSEEIVRSFAEQGVRLFSLPGPKGKASALNQAVPQARGEILVLCDARQQLVSQAVRELVSNFSDGTVGAVSGELHIDTRSGSTAGEGVGAYWTYEKWIRRLQSRIGSTVGVTGAIYALRRDLFRPLDPRLILDDVAVPLDVVAAGYRVVFEPRAQARDQTSDTPAREFKRKVRTLAGNYQLLLLRPWLLLPSRNPLFAHFVAHKLSRLAVPWCLLLVFLTSLADFFRGALLYKLVLQIQLAFYALALMGYLCDRLHVRVPFLSFPYAFTLLNLAAALSPISLFRGRQGAAWKGVSP